VRQEDPQFQLSKVVWFPSHSPKMAICLLRALHGKLLTRDFLQSIGVSDTVSCVLCGTGQESIQHLFFTCPYSAYLWTLCRLKLGLTGTIGTLEEEALLILTTFKNKTKTGILAKLTLSAIVWHIWKERNQRVFHLPEHHKIVVFRRLFEDIRLPMRTCHWKTDNQIYMQSILSNWNLQ